MVSQRSILLAISLRTAVCIIFIIYILQIGLSLQLCAMELYTKTYIPYRYSPGATGVPHIRASENLVDAGAMQVFSPPRPE